MAVIFRGWRLEHLEPRTPTNGRKWMDETALTVSHQLSPLPPGWWGKRHGSPTSAPSRSVGDIKLPVEKGWVGTSDGPLLQRNGVLMGFSCKYTIIYQSHGAPMEKNSLHVWIENHNEWNHINISLVKLLFCELSFFVTKDCNYPTDFSSEVVWCCLEDHLS